jgi:hypothetical protein
MIRAAAVTGAAAWTAPVIIDSIASPAAAASGGCTGSSVTLSWIYVLFQIPNGTIHVTGFSLGDSVCDTGGKNTHGSRCSTDSIGFTTWPACTSPTGVTITLNNFHSNPPDPTKNDITYNLAGNCGGTQSNNWTYFDHDTGHCDDWIRFDNGAIKAVNGATILNSMGFGAGELVPRCPDSASPNNRVCGIENT